jgi:hypothetical protein
MDPVQGFFIYRLAFMQTWKYCWFICDGMRCKRTRLQSYSTKIEYGQRQGMCRVHSTTNPKGLTSQLVTDAVETMRGHREDPLCSLRLNGLQSFTLPFPFFSYNNASCLRAISMTFLNTPQNA